MNANQIESKFAEMGARMVVREVPARVNAWSSAAADYAVDIQRDRKGEFFELRVPGHLGDNLEVSVMQSEPKRRHLLLLVRKTGDTNSEAQLDRFLCGHDEREWFLAAVPGGASSVRQAMDALQPPTFVIRLRAITFLHVGAMPARTAHFGARANGSSCRSLR